MSTACAEKYINPAITYFGENNHEIVYLTRSFRSKDNSISLPSDYHLCDNYYKYAPNSQGTLYCFPGFSGSALEPLFFDMVYKVAEEFSLDLVVIVASNFSANALPFEKKRLTENMFGEMQLAVYNGLYTANKNTNLNHDFNIFAPHSYAATALTSLSRRHSGILHNVNLLVLINGFFITHDSVKRLKERPTLWNSTRDFEIIIQGLRCRTPYQPRNFDNNMYLGSDELSRALNDILKNSPIKKENIFAMLGERDDRSEFASHEKLFQEYVKLPSSNIKRIKNAGHRMEENPEDFKEKFRNILSYYLNPYLNPKIL